MTLKNKLKELLSKLELQVSTNRNYQMARFISLLIGLEGILMIFICLGDKNYNSAYTSASYGIVMLFIFFYTTYTKKLNLFYIVAVAVIYAIEFVFLIGGGSQGFGVIWSVIFPILTVYIMSLKPFIIVNGICWLILVLGLWTPLSNFIYPYDEVFKARFPLVYLIIYIFGIFLSFKIRDTENQLEKQKNILTKEIEQAAQIQKVFYSLEPNYYEKFTLAFKTVPMAGVSGDLYDFFDDGHILKGLGIFDISGHGVSSGLLSLLSKNIIHSEFHNNKDLELWEVVQKINDRFIQEKGQVQNYLTGILLKIHEDDTIEYVNAGHLAPILYKKEEDTFEFLNKHVKAVGAIGMRTIAPFYYSQYVKMNSGDKLFLFTDGITDCENENGEAFGNFRLLKIFEKTIMTSPEEQISLILEEIKKFQKNTPAEDDITLIILKKD